MRLRAGLAVVCASVMLLAACGKQSRRPMSQMGAAGAATGGSAATACCAQGTCPCAEPPLAGHGVVPMQRLRGVEYQNSVADLLGVDVVAPAPDALRPYETIIDDAGPWFEAATAIAQELFAQAELPAPLDCVTAYGPARACALSAIDELGLRAFRRPLLEAERSAFVGLFDELEPEGSRAALEQVVRAMLLSPAFLFHVELSDDPEGVAAEPLDSYALAARLSFALWGTTPDASLLEAAGAGLDDDASLDAAYERLAQDQRVRALPDGFGDVWLGTSSLQTHAVDAQVFPDFSEELRQAMRNEQREVLRQYWLEPVPLRELLTLDLTFVDAALGQHYGYAAGRTGFVSEPEDARVGLLGQAALLTLTSLERRVSPTRRGRVILEQLLCGVMPEVPPGEAGSLGADFAGNLGERQTLEQQVAPVVCKGCHATLDPFGLALGYFDGIGALRFHDSHGQDVDARVTLPESLFPGAPVVNGLSELATAIGSSWRFHACVSQQLAGLFIRRPLSEATDADLIWPLGEEVVAQGTLPELTREIVMSDHFRFRRLPVAP